jgi:pimeloyl-ACP methyl ester carboxylesterase
LIHAAPDRWPLLAWPYSSLAEIGYGVVPGVAFVWLGFVIYLLLRREWTGYGLIRGFSQSLTVLLVATIILFLYLKDPKVDLEYVTRDDFYLTFHLCNVSLALAVSLLAALFTVPRTPGMSRTKRDSGDSITRRIRRVIRGVCLTLFLPLSAAAQTNVSAAKVQMVTVDQDVRLEVLDWGGTGRPLVFLAGLGNDAHVFDKFAPKFTANYHVYGITRRGFGASSKPAPADGNYSADRLGDDVLAVIDALKLDRPVLAGHSIAGEELSSIGSRHPEKVSGLIYLDAAMGYAYYSRSSGWIVLDYLDLKQRMDQFQDGAMQNPKQFMEDFLASVARFEKELQKMSKEGANTPAPPSPLPSRPPIIGAIQFGEQKYTEIHGPILAIFACPHNFDRVAKDNPNAKAELVANDLSRCTPQADAFTAGVPSAHVVRLPDADHYVFRSNEAEVIREMNTFLEKLP